MIKQNIILPPSLNRVLNKYNIILYIIGFIPLTFAGNRTLVTNFRQRRTPTLSQTAHLQIVAQQPRKTSRTTPHYFTQHVARRTTLFTFTNARLHSPRTLLRRRRWERRTEERENSEREERKTAGERRRRVGFFLFFFISMSSISSVAYLDLTKLSLIF